MVATIFLFTSVLIVAYFSCGHNFSLLCIGHSFIIFYYIVHCCLHGLKQPLHFPRHMILLIGYLSITLVFFSGACNSWSNQVLFAPSYLILIHTACDGNNLHHFIDALGFDDHLLDENMICYVPHVLLQQRLDQLYVMEPIQNKASILMVLFLLFMFVKYPGINHG